MDCQSTLTYYEYFVVMSCVNILQGNSYKIHQSHKEELTASSLFLDGSTIWLKKIRDVCYSLRTIIQFREDTVLFIKYMFLFKILNSIQSKQILVNIYSEKFRKTNLIECCKHELFLPIVFVRCYGIFLNITDIIITRLTFDISRRSRALHFGYFLLHIFA